MSKQLVLLEKRVSLDPSLCRECAGRCCQGSPGFSVAERTCQCLALIPLIATLAQPQGCLCRVPEVGGESELAGLLANGLINPSEGLAIQLPGLSPMPS